MPGNQPKGGLTAVDAGRRRRASQVLEEALARAESAREAYLREACAGDAELALEVMSLLAVAHGAERFRAEDDAAGVPPTPLAEEPGSIIGRYKLDRKSTRLNSS